VEFPYATVSERQSRAANRAAPVGAATGCARPKPPRPSCGKGRASDRCQHRFRHVARCHHCCGGIRPDGSSRGSRALASSRRSSSSLAFLCPPGPACRGVLLVHVFGPRDTEVPGLSLDPIQSRRDATRADARGRRSTARRTHDHDLLATRRRVPATPGRSGAYCGRVSLTPQAATASPTSWMRQPRPMGTDMPSMVATEACEGQRGRVDLAAPA
jgi:hypothetical protein